MSVSVDGLHMPSEGAFDYFTSRQAFNANLVFHVHCAHYFPR